MTNTVDIQVAAPDAPRILEHLRSRPEMVAFMRGSVADRTVTARKSWLLSDDELDLGDWHVSLNDHGQQRLMTWAHEAAVLIEAHSHGVLGGPACFSTTDLDGLKIWVPHLRWRIPGVAYIALVFGAETFDGLAWLPGASAVPVNEITFEQTGSWHATGRSFARWEHSDG